MCERAKIKATIRALKNARCLWRLVEGKQISRAVFNARLITIMEDGFNFSMDAFCERLELEEPFCERGPHSLFDYVFGFDSNFEGIKAKNYSLAWRLYRDIDLVCAY